MRGETNKRRILNHWITLPDHINPLRFMHPISADAKGHLYGSCGIRIDGNPQFVDAVLSNLKDIIPGENALTRLEIYREPLHSGNEGQDRVFVNADNNAEVCYIRLRQRPQHEIDTASANQTLQQTTQRYIQVKKSLMRLQREQQQEQKDSDPE